MLTLKKAKYELTKPFILFIIGILCIPVCAQQNENKEALLRNINQRSAQEKIEVYRKIYKLELHTRIDTAMHYAFLALDTYESSMGPTIKSDILSDIGTGYYYKTDYNEAASYLTDARNILISSNIKDKSLAIINNNLALVYKEAALFEKAVELYISNLLFFEKEGDTTRLAMTHNNLGIVYEKLVQHEKANEHYQAALQMNIRNDTYLNASVHLNIGVLYDLDGNIDSALHYYNISYGYYDTLGYDDSKAGIHYNIAQLYLEKNKLDSAEVYAEKSIKGLNEVGVENFTSYLILGDVYSKKGKEKQAINFYLKGLELGKNSSNKIDYLALITSIKEHFHRNNEYEKAYEYGQEEIELRKEIVNETRIKEIERLEIEYEVTLKNKEIELLNSQVLLKEQNLKISKKNSRLKSLWIGIIISILVMLVIFSFWLYRRNVYRRRLLMEKQRLLEKEKVEQQLIIDNSLLEKEAFLKEKKLDEQNKVHLQERLDQKNRELVSISLINSEKKELLQNILERLDNSMDVKNVVTIKKMIKENISSSDNWNDLKLHFESVHPNFFGVLKERSDKLSQLDLKHCVYIKMRISNKEIAQILNVNPRSIVVAHYRIKKKLRLPEEQSLISFIEELS